MSIWPPLMEGNPPNSSKSIVFYLASGCEERVGEGFESRVTRWNPRKDVRVHKVHVRASYTARMDVRGHGHPREGAQRAVERTGRRGKDTGVWASVSTDVRTSGTYEHACACKPRGRPGHTSVGTRKGARARTDVRSEARASTRAQVSAREEEEEAETFEAKGGCPWVPRPKRRNWEKARFSIGHAFKVRGSN
ncbi:hypothetical protein CRG98_012168 [Punica granatum]|uniref:Uncharacterized protein n=1 Tax=Punica granatum TaxID=22663 RepID=A0A2I0KG22_PUNGR|nr:hypothetical protein CRG98_012168 [Punica granatum]